MDKLDKSPLRLVVIILLFFNILLLDGLVGYQMYQRYKLSSDGKESVSEPQYEMGNSDISEADEEEVVACSQQCVNLIDKKIADISLPTATPQSTAAPVTTEAKSTTKTRTTVYISIPGSGSTLENSWTDLIGTEFYFDPGEHPGIIEARFEATMHLVNGNGEAWLRLFDVTHGIGVQNGEVHTSSQHSIVMTSGNIFFWSGRNLYRVQAKSLTADTTVFNGGRIKIVTEN